MVRGTGTGTKAKNMKNAEDSEDEDVKATNQEKEDLRKEVKELNLRIGELEEIITELQEPLRQMQSAAKGYFKFINLYMKYGEISPEILIPDIKDSISKEILNVLFDKNGQNISQITESVRSRRGSASRRIIREKLGILEIKGYVVKKRTKKSVDYYVSDELLKKWSQVLGLNK
jgi:predicted nuclease with TOPRIM domain